VELADGNYGPPYVPPPEEPVKVHCHPELDRIKQAWLKIMPNVEFCSDLSKCKILLLGDGAIIGREAADKLLEFLARYGTEALTYQYRELEKKFFLCDRVWLETPGRIIPDLGNYGARGW
jgi:hypothetical protein